MTAAGRDRGRERSVAARRPASEVVPRGPRLVLAKRGRGVSRVGRRTDGERRRAPVPTGRPEGAVPGARGADAVLGRGRRLPALGRATRGRAGVGLLRRSPDGQREAAHRPRRHAHVQGRLPSLPDDDGPPRPPEGRWDCHGLPVEIEVEKEIGTSGKRDIEAFGVAAFNERCRVSVRRYVSDWEQLTRRIGFWIDMDDAYWTMDRVHRVRVVVAEAAPRARSPRRGRQGHRVLPSVRHGALRRRGRPRLRDGRGPERLRRFPSSMQRIPTSSACRSSCGRRRRGRSRRTPASPWTDRDLCGGRARGGSRDRRGTPLDPALGEGWTVRSTLRGEGWSARGTSLLPQRRGRPHGRRRLVRVR